MLCLQPLGGYVWSQLGLPTQPCFLGIIAQGLSAYLTPLAFVLKKTRQLMKGQGRNLRSTADVM